MIAFEGNIHTRVLLVEEGMEVVGVAVAGNRPPSRLASASSASAIQTHPGAGHRRGSLPITSSFFRSLMAFVVVKFVGALLTAEVDVAKIALRIVHTRLCLL